MTEMEIIVEEEDSDQQLFDVNVINWCDYYLSKQFSDFSFVISETGEEIPAHKVILAAKSAVLWQKFADNPKLNKIILQKTTAQAVKAFLVFIYFDRYLLTDETHIANCVSILSKHFEIPYLAERADEELSAIINSRSVLKASNFMEWFILSKAIDCKKITEKVNTFKDQNMVKILKFVFMTFNSMNRIKRIVSALKPSQTQVENALTGDVIANSHHKRKDFQVFIQPKNC